MNVSLNSSLKDYNTFGIDVNAKQLISVSSMRELKQVLRNNYSNELFILGGGSNMLLTRDINATVLHINLKGKELLSSSSDSALVRINAGENWHETVQWTLEHNLGGLENLSLIPGNTGTAPIQNIGAYGVELKDTFVSCDVIDVQTLETRSFSKEECDFGYRSSIFKTSAKGKYIITSVTFQLTRKDHNLHTEYGSIKEALLEMGIKEPGLKDVSAAVIKIRSQKLPDPKVLGNSGSFFKNPVLPVGQLIKLQDKYPDIPFYSISKEEVKVPAGWLIEQAGFKGYREGDAGVHKNQALVLVNYGEASGNEILHLAHKIQDKILKDYGIDLQPEVNIY
ncbi:UDP-N-acetylmuramate dehydrogenase [Antarcticibacterium flavum]|uniref:UDP-N-acetylenolpyruvoylglucosamine reductase n=1 Tax=Antarcticibacterium flavum TaxID=2058175 RepID=A0A5B7X5B6_9FLAO|nr:MULTISPECIES: UDP-N-acetylmuramate dehydrogenase [Antarcticibacterium]MCM4160010.1 UDP-N-acetylenolpyruvoylglucosamine reductase [Antarcticibacterium sp. W02-3]QCY70400.1 UDP-N-acetylmuramate dehydrogenase [Antarcticibacterium flavum]